MRFLKYNVCFADVQETKYNFYFFIAAIARFDSISPSEYSGDYYQS